MFRYLVEVETLDVNGNEYWHQSLISRLSPADYVKEALRFRRKYPEAKRIDVTPLEESEYRQRLEFQNRHED